MWQWCHQLTSVTFCGECFRNFKLPSDAKAIHLVLKCYRDVSARDGESLFACAEQKDDKLFMEWFVQVWAFSLTVDSWLPPLGFCVKDWAQKMHIHGASRGCFSAFFLFLMVIQYLQRGCAPPVLPNLQVHFPVSFWITTYWGRDGGVVFRAYRFNNFYCSHSDW